MEELLTYQFTWGQFLGLAIGAVLFYFVLNFLLEVVIRLPLSDYIKTKTKQVFRNVQVIYEPIAFLVIIVAFVLMKPLFYGLIVFILLTVGFSYLKTYMSGRLFLLNQHIGEGTILKIKDNEGIVTKMGRMGIDLQTNEGLHRVNYESLIKEGYILVASDEIGGFYHLKVSPKTESKVKHPIYLADRLATTPYIDWGHKPDISALNNTGNELEIRVLIKEENHLYDLIALIKEWGYQCELSVK